MQTPDRLIGSSRLVILIATAVNRAFLACVGVGLVASLLFGATVARLLIDPSGGASPQSQITGIRLLLVIGIVMGVAMDRLLTALGRMIASARLGDPFVADNARRLWTIGRALLALQLLDIPGLLVARFFPHLGSAEPAGDFSVGGWVAVLLVFVLARVFAAGSGMRDELQATV